MFLVQLPYNQIGKGKAFASPKNLASKETIWAWFLQKVTEYHMDTQQKAKDHFTIVICYLDRMLTGCTNGDGITYDAHSTGDELPELCQNQSAESLW